MDSLLAVGAHSRRKGAVGEREFARLLTDRGVEAHRGQQFAGGPDSPDVVHSLPGVHFEVKRTEQLRLWPALEQAENDAPEDSVPVVAFRSNRRPWVVILRAWQFVDMRLELERLRAEVELFRAAWEDATSE